MVVTLEYWQQSWPSSCQQFLLEVHMGPLWSWFQIDSTRRQALALCLVQNLQDYARQCHISLVQPRASS